MKVCTNCNLPKEEFPIYKKVKGVPYFKNICKDCFYEERNKYRRGWRSNPEVKKREKEQNREYYWNDPDKYRLAVREYYKTERGKENSKKWKTENKDRVNESRRKNHSLNPDKNRKKAKEWYDNNSKKAVGYQKKYYEKNKERLKPILSERCKRYRLKNPEKSKERKIKYYYSNQQDLIKKEKVRYYANKSKPEFKDKLKLRAKRKWSESTPDERMSKAAFIRNRREDLADWYVKYAMGFNKEDYVPQHLIEAKRQQLLLIRKIKQNG